MHIWLDMCPDTWNYINVCVAWENNPANQGDIELNSLKPYVILKKDDVVMTQKKQVQIATD